MTQEFWDRKAETMPLRDLKALQCKRLQKLIKYVYTTNQFYHKKISEAKVKPDYWYVLLLIVSSRFMLLLEQLENQS